MARGDTASGLALLLVLWVVVCAGSAAAAGESGCVLEVADAVAGSVPAVTADCRWPVPSERVAEVARDQGEIAAVLSSVSESTLLPDGRVLQVHSMGFGVADRQVTLDLRVEPLEGSGVRVEFSRSREQEHLAPGRVEIPVDEGFWLVSSDGEGTRLRYALRYDAGGHLEPWLARRFLRAGVARALAEVRQAAERLTRGGEPSA